MVKKAFVGFAGFGGIEIALSHFGFEVVGIEIDPAIAFVAWLNSHNTITADLLDIDPVFYQDYDIFHFSPPCPNFSTAKVGGSESDQDLALARKICEFVKLGRPLFFTLENVWGYRNSLSWLLIWYTLLECGYGVDGWHLNAADYGVPQSRRRMIVVARRDGRQPTKPFPTHSAKPDFFTKPHIGWYEAVEDLIGTLPDSEFAPWQKERLPEEMRTLLIMTGNTNKSEADCQPGRGVIDWDKPSNTVMASSGAMPRALILGQGGRSSPKRDDEPMVTVQTRPPERCPHRAFLVDGTAQSNLITRDQNEPANTVTASRHKGMGRAFITRGYIGGRTISMTPRALARFQGFPDNYALPANRELACRGIGNAVPPPFYRAVLKSLELDALGT